MSYIATLVAELHSKHEEVEIRNGGRCEILVVAGDITHLGTISELYEFNEFVKGLSYEHVIVVPGNRDIWLENERIVKHILSNCTCLIDEYVILNGKKIYGSPWTKIYDERYAAFTVENERELKEKWSKIPDDTNILITHSPPYGYLDKDVNGYSVGSTRLFERVAEIQPELHVFSHAHKSSGDKTQRWANTSNNTRFTNASVMGTTLKVYSDYRKGSGGYLPTWEL